MRLFFLFAILLSLSPPSSGRQQHKPSNSKNIGSANSQPTTSITTINNNPPSGKQVNGSEDQPRQWPPRHSSFWSNWALVFVGLFTGIAAILTLLAIDAQTEQVKNAADATAKNASAALKQATAIFNAERPWMLIKIKVGSGVTLPGDVPLHVYFDVSFRNCGKTVAEIVSFDQELQCWPLEALPSPPKYANEGHVLLHTRMVALIECGAIKGSRSSMPRRMCSRNNGKRYGPAANAWSIGEDSDIEI